jgi:hypothetical protein
MVQLDLEDARLCALDGDHQRLAGLDVLLDLETVRMQLVVVIAGDRDGQ